MNLWELAESDLGKTLENKTSGFGRDITLTNPAGTALALIGDAGDISQMIDIETGELVSGRLAQCLLRISSILAGGLEVPEGIFDTASKPWLVTFTSINGVAFTFSVKASYPDRKIGVVKLQLGTYKS
tara:strand:+ start:124 stop:507 length:384 start_codon:yes stop_codon:yes gene_type:complete